MTDKEYWMKSGYGYEGTHINEPVSGPNNHRGDVGLPVEDSKVNRGEPGDLSCPVNEKHMGHQVRSIYE